MNDALGGGSPTVNVETKILLALIALFSVGGAVSLWLNQPPVITAINVGLVATACLYRFLGGVESSTFKMATFKASGSVAVCSIAVWYVNGQLVALNPTVQPTPADWVALDRTGAPVDIRIGQESLVSDPSVLADAVWSAATSVAGTFRVVAGDDTLARIDPASLGSVGLFNQVRMPSGRAILFTEELAVGMEDNLFPPYPFRIRATGYRDDYNGYSILSRDDDSVVEEDALITKNFKVFEYNGQFFAVFVARAVHNDPEREPWAVYGFAQLELSVGSPPG